MNRNRKKYIIQVTCLLLFCLCICGYGYYNYKSEWKQTENEVDERAVLEEYNAFISNVDTKGVAFLYLDSDTIPELVSLENGKYKLYYFDNGVIKPITISGEEVQIDSYGYAHAFEEPSYVMKYWIEYVPYGGRMRAHHGKENGRNDIYLKYENGSLEIELRAKSQSNQWYTYNHQDEIPNEEFVKQYTELGYDKLIPCGELYSDVQTAFLNRNNETNTKTAFDEFVKNEKEALVYLEIQENSVEPGGVFQKYCQFFEEITEGEEEYGEVQYVDYDNDGEEELVLKGYAGAALFFDAIDDTVYKVLKTGGTTDVANIATYQGDNVIIRADVMHTGRQHYIIMKYDGCGCVVDYSRLYAEYAGTTYAEGDKFFYRNRQISMEEYEQILQDIIY